MQISSRQCLLPTWPVAAQHQLYPHFQHISFEPHTTVVLLCKILANLRFRKVPPFCHHRQEQRPGLFYLQGLVWPESNLLRGRTHFWIQDKDRSKKQSLTFKVNIHTDTWKNNSYVASENYRRCSSLPIQKPLHWYQITLHNTSLIAFFFFFFEKSQVASLEIHTRFIFSRLAFANFWTSSHDLGIMQSPT